MYSNICKILKPYINHVEMKKYNFNAGPSILPREVIENTAKQILDFNGSGLSLMEISHRAKDFQPVVDETTALIKELLDIPEGYSVIFLGGGASLQFMQIPANFLVKKAGYLNTGAWAKKALKEAKHFGEVVEVASSADDNYTHLPHNFTIPTDIDYLHICANNTIYGTELRKDLDSPVPLIGDMSSDIMSRPVDVSKYTAIYAGAQKNMAMAGVLDDATNKWGIKVNRVELQDIIPPSSVLQAMEKQMQAERDKRATILTSEGNKQAQILQSEGEKQAKINKAEAAKQQAILIAEGEAEARIRKAEAEAAAIDKITAAVGQSTNPANYLLAKNYIQMLSDVSSGDKTKTVFLPFEASNLMGSIGGIKELFKG